MKKYIFLLFFTLIATLFTPSVSAAVPTLHGQRFAWVNNGANELTEETLQYMAINYDLVVVGNQGRSDDNAAKRLKELNPSIKVLFYFPTSLRAEGAQYGRDAFKEEWYLKDLSGNRIHKGRTSFWLVDLSNADYRAWAEAQILEFLRLAPYDGVAMDNANPLGGEDAFSEKMKDLVGEAKVLAWDKARIQYLTKLTRIMETRGKVLIYNGIHRARVKENRTLATLDFTDGALNEGFCYGQDNTGSLVVVNKELQLEDINLQKDIGNRSKYLLQKVNMPANILERYSRYCYGVFLMGYVPDFTFFKYGEGYNLRSVPNEYKTNPKEIDLPLGAPKTDYQRPGGGWILQRRFENGWVVVNLEDKNNIWTAPQNLELWNGGVKGRNIAEGSKINVPAQDTLYLLKPTTAKPGDLNGDNKVNTDDYDLLISKFGHPYTIFDYNKLVANYGK